MKYDDYAWHYGGEFPRDLPQSAGATHIAMFVAWAFLNGLASDFGLTEFAADLETLRARAQTPAAWFILACDGQFVDDLLDDAGNVFATSYYADDAQMHSGPGTYLDDYETPFAAADTLYHVPDDWAAYDKMSAVIQGRFAAWQARVAEAVNDTPAVGACRDNRTGFSYRAAGLEEIAGCGTIP